MIKILLLEDDQSFGYILSEYLEMKDFTIDWAKSGETAIQLLDQHIYHLAILDIMLPGIDGFEVARYIKQQHGEIPFIFLSAKSLKIDKLKGYQIGAYDYVTKPIDEEILVAKIKALLAQTKPVTENKKSLIKIGVYAFEPALFQLHHQEEVIRLTARETALLDLLCQHKNQLMSRKLALQKIWGSTDEFSRKSMDVFISHLRKYLAKDDSISIDNVHGQGFILRCS